MVEFKDRVIADFPEYAKYLPTPVAKRSMLVVIPSESRAKLSALGIPGNG